MGGARRVFRSVGPKRKLRGVEHPWNQSAGGGWNICGTRSEGGSNLRGWEIVSFIPFQHPMIQIRKQPKISHPRRLLSPSLRVPRMFHSPAHPGFHGCSTPRPLRLGHLHDQLAESSTAGKLPPSSFALASTNPPRLKAFTASAGVNAVKYTREHAVRRTLRIRSASSSLFQGFVVPDRVAAIALIINAAQVLGPTASSPRVHAPHTTQPLGIVNTPQLPQQIQSPKSESSL